MDDTSDSKAPKRIINIRRAGVPVSPSAEASSSSSLEGQSFKASRAAESGADVEGDRSAGGVEPVHGVPCAAPDAVNHPPHYNTDPSGVECIVVTEHRSFCVGNAMKYLWRAGLKGDSQFKHIEDLEKSIWYIQREISRLKRFGNGS